VTRKRNNFSQGAKTGLDPGPGVGVSKSQLGFLEIDRFRWHKTRLELTKNELQVALVALGERSRGGRRDGGLKMGWAT
jgi:hypothetical protein